VRADQRARPKAYSAPYAEAGTTPSRDATGGGPELGAEIHYSDRLLVYYIPGRPMLETCRDLLPVGLRERE